MSALGHKRTCAVHKAMSALCHKRTFSPALSYDECTARVPRTATACQNEAIEVVKCR